MKYMKKWILVACVLVFGFLGWQLMPSTSSKGTLLPGPDLDSVLLEAPQPVDAAGASPSRAEVVPVAPSEPAPVAQEPQAAVRSPFDWAAPTTSLDEEGRRLVGPERWAELLALYEKSRLYDPERLKMQIGVGQPSWEEDLPNIEPIIMRFGNEPDDQRGLQRDFVRRELDTFIGEALTDWQASNFVNWEHQKLTKEQNKILTECDRKYRAEAEEFLISHYLPVVQRVKQLELSAGKYGTYPLLPSDLVIPETTPPSPGQEPLLEVGLGSGTWVFHMCVWRGEYPDLDWAYDQLQGLASRWQQEMRGLITGF